MSKEIKKTIKLEYRKTIGILLLSFILLGFLVSASNLLQPLDKRILASIIESKNPHILRFAWFMEWFGSAWGYAVIGILLLAYCFRKRSYQDIKLYIATAVAVGASNQLLKIYYDRERPLEFFRIDKTGMSFPSGHSMGVMAIYIVVACILARRFPRYKKVIYILSGIIIAVMGWSRLYLGVHWPTDILGGYLGGAIVALIMINLEKRGYKIKSR